MTSVELQPKLERRIAVGEAAVWTFFSVQLQERHKADGRLHSVGAATVHTPCGAGAEQALEVGVLAICGRSASQPRRTVFAFGLVGAVVVCALAAWAYPRDPDFSLDATQRAFGSLGVFAVLAGACALACVWFPGSFCRATTSRCQLAHATLLLIYCEDGSQHVAAVQTRTGPDGITSCRCCNFRQLRFVFDAHADAFQVGDASHEDGALGGPLTQGLSEDAAKQRRAWHGSNLILVPMPSLPRQAADEVLNPFVFFQFFSCVQWTLQAYWHYALIVLLITVIAAAVSLVISRQNFRRLRDLSHHEALVSVRRGGLEMRLLSTELVPGDVFVVEEGMDLPCDAVLVFGEALISEAMLTGESVPVAKVAVVPGSPVSAKAQLFGGTRVLQTRAPGGAAVLARCTRIGFSTEKGRLIRSILFPRSGRLDLTRDGNRFVAFVLLPMAVAGGIASCVHALQAGGAFTVASALDLVSIAVPPALPAAMMIGVATAVDRLRSRAIFCIAPNRVNMAGRITRVCFDKTGTLTFDGMTMLAVRPLMPDGAAFGDEVSAPGAVMFDDEVPAAEVPGKCAVVSATTPQERMALVMAACQSLRLLGDSLIGDPLEVVMLESSGWALSTGDHDAVRVTAPGGKLCASQLQTFDFNSELARMAVVVRVEQSTGAAVRVLVKGSPEAVASLCDPATLPSNFEAMLALYAGGGYRVLGCADRILTVEQAAAAAVRSLARVEAEAAGQLQFVGLVVLENKLKPSSAGVIAALQAAAMNVCMITGDHARTAVTVGRAANILSRDARVVLCDASPGGPPSYTKLATTLGEADEPADAACVLGTESEGYRFVATGAGFDALLAAAEQGAPEALACVLKRLSIAARFQPHQKQRAVNLFIEGGEFTAFVGDGANDSAALKAADVGLSLTADAEASVAAAFTSKDAELVSCITLLLEGRAALATAFQLFRFMALYVLVMICCVSSAMKPYALAPAFAGMLRSSSRAHCKWTWLTHVRFDLHAVLAGLLTVQLWHRSF